MGMLKPWLVISPEYGEVVPILDDGTGPMEYGSNFVFVEAETKKDALMLGVLMFRGQRAKYLADSENPYAGVKVQSLVCQVHGGLPLWNKDHYECGQCEAGYPNP